MDTRSKKRLTKVVSLPTGRERPNGNTRKNVPSHEPLWAPLKRPTRGAEPSPWPCWLT